MKKVWLVKFPTHQYKEDVKELAARKGLKIIDAKFKAEIAEKHIESKPPKLTLKSDAEVAAKPAASE